MKTTRRRALLSALPITLAGISFGSKALAKPPLAPLRSPLAEHRQQVKAAQESLCASAEVTSYLTGRRGTVGVMSDAANKVPGAATPTDLAAVARSAALAARAAKQDAAAAQFEKAATDVTKPAADMDKARTALRDLLTKFKIPLPSLKAQSSNAKIFGDADLVACAVDAPAATCGDVLDRTCPSTGIPEAGEGTGIAPELSGVTWQTAVAQGLAQYLQQRAGDELTVWLEDEVVRRLCEDSYELGTKKLEGKKLFPKTCDLTTTGTTQTIGATFAAALRADLEGLPLELAIQILNINEKVAVSLGSALARLRQGAPPLPLIASLADDDQLRGACTSGDELACTLVGVAVLVRFSADAQKDQAALATELARLATNNDLVAEFANAVNVEIDNLFPSKCSPDRLKPGAPDALKNSCFLKPLDPTKDREAIKTFLQDVQSIYQLVETWNSTPGNADPATRGAQLTRRSVDLVDAGASFLGPTQKAAFTHVWDTVEPALSASSEVMTGQAAEGVRDALTAALAAAKQAHLSPTLVTTVSLAADLGSAKDASGVQAALQSAAAPLGSWKSKHEHFSLSLNGFVGGAFGYELPLSGTTPDLQGGYAGSAFAPMGIDVAGPLGDTHWSWGLFLSALDVGQLMSSPVGATTPNSSQPKTPVPGGSVSIAQVLAPGLYGHLSLGNSPITVGLGIGAAPQLRTYNVGNTGTQLQESMFRANAFLAVDLDLIPIYTAH